jgi:hypothetical protein
VNIFVTNKCPYESARFLDDKRVVKMVLESMQMLGSALILNGGTSPYKLTHQNHPCTQWVSENHSNYWWLYQHFVALCEEYTKRYDKIHKCEQYRDWLIDGAEFLPDGDLTEFVNCTPYKDKPVTEAYRQTLRDKWKADKRRPTWYGYKQRSVA